MSPHPDPLWKALWTDTASLVFVVDPSGSIAETNGRHDEFGIADEPRSLEDLSNAEGFAREHLALIKQATERDGPVTIRGYFRGRFARITYRRLNEGDRVLGVVTLDIDHAGRGKQAQPTQGTPNGAVRARHDDLGPLEKLTNREVEVLRLIGMGFSTAQIAENLDRSVKTVEWHRVSLGNKLAVSNRVELARIAIRSGLCSVSA